MNVGNLIRITRPIVGVPAGTLALIINTDLPDKFVGDSAAAHMAIHTVQLLGLSRERCGSPTRRFLERDLEVVNA